MDGWYELHPAASISTGWWTINPQGVQRIRLQLFNSNTVRSCGLTSQNGHIFWRKLPAGPARARWWQRSNKSRQPSGACASDDLVASRGDVSSATPHEFTSIEIHAAWVSLNFISSHRNEPSPCYVFWMLRGEKKKRNTASPKMEDGKL